MLKRLLLLSVLSSVLWTAFAQPQPTDRSDEDSRSYGIVGEGSTATHREIVDAQLGQVYIYGGGTIPVGTHLVSIHFLFDESTVGNTSGYITPLLLQQTSRGIYTVIGIGKGYEVVQSLQPQVIPFKIVVGVKVPISAECTFGYINALVDPNGIPTETSPGTVDFDYFGDPGHGVGGPLTSNDWAATGLANGAIPVVTLGTTFGAAGSTYPFYELRTYSAFMDGVVAR